MSEDRSMPNIAELVEKYHQAVYRYAFRLSGSAADAEDLTQQAFLAAQQKVGQLRKPESASHERSRGAADGQLRLPDR